MRVPWEEIPKDIQERLIRLTLGGSGDGFVVHRRSGATVQILKLLVCAAVLAAPAYWLSTQTEIQYIEMIMAWGFLGFLPALVLVTGIPAFFRTLRSRVRPAILVNRTMIVETGCEGEPVLIQRYRTSGGDEQRRLAWSYRRYIPESDTGLGDDDWFDRLGGEEQGRMQLLPSGGELAGCLVFGLSFPLALALSGGAFFWAHQENVRRAEASHWGPAGITTAEQANAYLDWAEGVDPAILDARIDQGAMRRLYARLNRTRRGSPAYEKLNKELEAYYQLEQRRDDARMKGYVDSLKRFTPYEEHLAKAQELAGDRAGSARRSGAPP